MNFRVAALCAALPICTWAASASEISTVLQPFIDRHELAGVVTLVVSKDEVLNLEAVGYADIATKKSMRIDAMFWIASISKPITATALMMLVDEGRVHLDDPVIKYLPEFQPHIIAVAPDNSAPRVQKSQHQITVRQLLSHTSGLPFSSSIERPTLDVFSLATRVQSYSLNLLRFEPGSDYEYSNAGINTVGRIIEVVSGIRYEDFLQQKLFGPLGMKDTTFWPDDDQLVRIAKSYAPNANLVGLQETHVTQLHYPLTDRKHRYPMPAGGLFSTASDLGRLSQMILKGGVFGGKRYLSERALREMVRNQLDPARQPAAAAMAKFRSGYGLGWATYASGAFGHGGAYSTDMRIDPEHGLATIWLVQHAGFPGEGRKSQAAFQDLVEKKFASKDDSRLSSMQPK
jgi:CubicO group peptidase (beta-lactamase class C family)